MKKIHSLFGLTLLLAGVLFVQDSRAQDYTRFSLPEGAVARLGKGSINDVAYSPDGTRLAVASSIGIWLYNAHTGAEVALLTGQLTGHRFSVNSMAFSPDGNTLASGSGDSTIRLWNVDTWQVKHILTGHAGGVNSMAFSPDGNTLASGSGDSTIRLWNVDTGQGKYTLTGHTSSVESVAFSPDGKTLASGSFDLTVRLWNVDTGQGKHILAGHTDDVNSVAFSPDGNTLASGSFDLTVRLWNVDTGQGKRTLTGHTDAVTSVTFSSDGNTLASGSYDNMIRLWDVDTGQVKITLMGHSSLVLSVAFSPDGKTLTSGSYDGTILLWDTSAWTKTGSDISIGTDRPDELIGKWKSVISDDEAETTSVLEFDANGRFMYSEKTTSHESLKQNLIREFGADPGRIRFVADSLAVRKSRFHDALVADKQMSGTEMRGTWSVWGNAIHVVVDSFSLSFNGLQGNDIFEFLETIIPLVVPAKNVGFVEFLFLLTFTFLQETFNALVEAREIFEIGTYFFENDNLILVQDESQIRYTRVSEMITPDFDGDGTVGITDFLLFVDQFGLSQGDAGYDARFDLDGDGVIGISDFLIFVNAFGQKGG